MNAAIPIASIRPTREQLEQTEQLLAAEGYSVLPITGSPVLAPELREAFHILASRADASLLVCACAYDAFEHLLLELDMGPVRAIAKHNHLAAQLVGWVERASGWRCRRAALWGAQ